MRLLIFSLSLFFVWSHSSFAKDPLSLNHIDSFAMPPGTHRPEIVAGPDGDLFVVVVAPAMNPSQPDRQIKHQAYHYTKDLKQVGNPFPVTTITTQYGDPSDHRALIANNQLIVVYQSNVWKGGRFPIQASGPMEAYAENQSLMLARFDLQGNEITRVPIVANALPGTGENFPDMAIAWQKDHLLITTSTGAQKLKIREVSLDGKILSTHEYPAGPGQTLSSDMGNSLVCTADGYVILISGNGPQSINSLTLTAFNQNGEIEKSITLPSNQRQETFPTGININGNIWVITYISRLSGMGDFNQNPYSPYIKIIDNHGDVLADEKIGDFGVGHVHPTVAFLGDTYFIAWSRRLSDNPTPGTPFSQVQIESYQIKPATPDAPSAHP